MNISTGGRPPKDPNKKIGRPVRALVTPPVEKALIEAAEMHGISYVIDTLGRTTVPSDLLRLWMAQGLKKDGLWTEEIAADPTWDALKQAGLL